MKPSIVDVAKKAGLSVVTVSRVLNGATTEASATKPKRGGCMGYKGARKGRRTLTFRYKLQLSYMLLVMIPVLSALLIYGVLLYHQTKVYYRDLLVQLANRTTLIIDDFFVNHARSSFFYLADSRLQEIVTMKQLQGDRQYLDDFLYVQTALDQLVMLNGNISAIAVKAQNGRTYSSRVENELKPEIVQALARPELRSGQIIVSAPYESSPSGSKRERLVSILRNVSPLDSAGEVLSYVRTDIKFKAIENILGGLPDSNEELATLVLAGNKVIYHSHNRNQPLEEHEMSELVRAVTSLQADQASYRQFKMNGETYWFSAIRNRQTQWTIVHYFPAALIDRTFLTSTRNYIILSLLCLTSSFILALSFTRQFILPIHRLNAAMKRVDTGNLDRLPDNADRNDEIGRLIRSYNAMIDRLKESRNREIVSSQLQKKAELNMLQAQINPHFLYNTLNTIHAIAQLNNVPEITTMASSLSSMYRYNIKTGDIVTIASELEQIRHYVSIQQIRFPGKFRVNIEAEEAALSCRILKFLLQPIVENAFYHGLEPKGDQGTLTIAITVQGQLLMIRIVDDGVGMHREQLDRLQTLFDQETAAASPEGMPHFGLRNVCARIKYYYGDRYWLRMQSAPGEGTCVELAIPALKGEDGK